METSLAPVDVANHWPYLREQLLLERWPSARVALDAVAVRQAEGGGSPATFGSRFWLDSGMTKGQASRVTQTLVELERRRVLSRHRGAGRRPHAWSFVPSVRHWVAMPWVYSGRDAERAISLCACTAACPVVPRLPGQGTALSRGKDAIRLPEKFHLLRPGVFPVDTRDYGASRGTTGRRPALQLVDTRDYGAADGPNSGVPLLSPDEFKLIREKQRFDELIEAYEIASDQELWENSKYWRLLVRAYLRAAPTPAQEEALVLAFRRWSGRVHRGNVASIVEDLGVEQSVKGAGRSPVPRGSGPALIDLGFALPPDPGSLVGGE